MRTRSNGEGTITQLANGRFLVRVPIGFYPSGQVRYRSKTLGTRKQANAAHRKMLEDRDRGLTAQPTTQKLGAYLAYWCEEVIKPTREAATYALYAKLCRLYVIPALGQISVAKLSERHVQLMLNDLAKRPTVSSATVQRTRDVLRNALNALVVAGHLVRNVAKLAVVPPVEHPPILAFRADEARRFLAHARSHRYAAAFFVAMLGLREGELLGLTWACVDLERGLLSVEQQLSMASGKPALKRLKTKTSRRTLVLPEPMAAQLAIWRDVQADDAYYHAHRYVPSDLVFTTTIGAPLRPRQLLRHYHDVLAAAGLQRRPFHHVRHSSASLLRALGVDAKVVQAILGHASPLMTDHYTHVSDEQTAVALSQLTPLFASLGDD